MSLQRFFHNLQISSFKTFQDNHLVYSFQAKISLANKNVNSQVVNNPVPCIAFQACNSACIKLAWDDQEAVHTGVHSDENILETAFVLPEDYI